MAINRSDIYSRVHKGLRKSLFEWAMTAGNTDYNDPASLQHLYHKAEDAIEFLRVHGEVEDKFQLPIIEKKIPGSSQVDSEEHHRLDQLVNQLEELTNVLKDVENKEEAGYEYYLAVNRFISEYLMHINNEEVYTFKTFAENVTEQEVMESVQKINTFTTPEQKALAFKYMIPAASHPERVAFLSGIKNANPQAYNMMMGLAEQHLPQEEMTKLRNALEGALV